MPTDAYWSASFFGPATLSFEQISIPCFTAAAPLIFICSQLSSTSPRLLTPTYVINNNKIHS